MDEVSSIFLEGDISRELERLRTAKAEILNTISMLDTMPDKVEQDCMVPLTKVAFMPGKIVHTNEVLTEIGQNYHVWRSAKQTQQYLRRRIEQVESQIIALKQSIYAEDDEQEDDNAETLSVQPTPTSAATTSTQPIDNTDDQAEQFSEGGFPLMDIREYIDENGNPMSSEVVDLAQQFAQSKDQLQSLRSKANRSKMDTGDKEQMEKAEKIAQALEHMENQLSEEESSYSSQMPVDEDHEGFVGQLARTYAKATRIDNNSDTNNNSSQDDVLQILEALEAAEEQANQQAQRDRANINSAGWKKGFLSSSNKTKSSTTAAPPVPVPAPIHTSPQSHTPDSHKSILKKSPTSDMKHKSVHFEDDTPNMISERKTVAVTSVSAATPSQMPPPSPAPAPAPQAHVSIVGEIKENVRIESSPSIEPINATASVQPTQRVSKFKQQRQQAKNNMS